MTHRVQFHSVKFVISSVRRETSVGRLPFIFAHKMNHGHRFEDLILTCLNVLQATYTCKRKMPLLQIHLLGGVGVRSAVMQ